MTLDWQQSALRLVILAVEVCWLYVLAAFLNDQTVDGRLSVLGLLLLFPIAFGFNRLLSQVRWPRILIVTISWLAWALAMLLMVKIQLFSNLGLSDTDWLTALPEAIADMFYNFSPELLILVSSVVMWWLGRRLAYLRINFAVSLTEFQFGLAIMLIILFVSFLLDGEIAGSVPIAIAFFLLALSGVFLAHARERTGWLEVLQRGRWFGLLLVCIAIILILGLLIGAIVTDGLLELLLTPFKWMWGLAQDVFGFFADLLPDSNPGEPPPDEGLGILDFEGGSSEDPGVGQMSDSTRRVLAAVFTVFLISCVLLALWRISSVAFSLLRRMLATGAGAELEPLPGSFRVDLVNLLRRLALMFLGLRRLFRLPRRSVSLPSEAASIRHTYRQLLRWAARKGYARRMSQTPYEYSHFMGNLLPVAQDDLRLITEQYVSTRYSPSLPTKNELHEVKQSWYRVKRMRLKKRTANPLTE